MHLPDPIRRHGVDAAVIAMSLVTLLVALVDDPGELWRHGGALVPLLFLGRHAFPLLAPVATIWLTLALDASGVPAFHGENLQGAILWVGLVLAAAGSRGVRAVLGWALVAAPLGIDMLVLNRVDDEGLVEFVWLAVLVGLAFLAVRTIVRQREQSAQLRQQSVLLAQQARTDAQLAVSDERLRIAREVHDIVAHSLTAIVLHAGGLRRMLDDSMHAERAILDTIEQSGRSAMSEIRGVLGVLRHQADEDGHPLARGLHELPQLVDTMRAAGMVLQLEVDGDLDGLARSLDLATYRVVQEGVTNALRHAPGAPVTVRIERCDDRLVVEVANGMPGRAPGAGSDAGEPHPRGHGLVGIRERVALLGGTMRIERDRGHHVLRAELPLVADTSPLAGEAVAP